MAEAADRKTAWENGYEPAHAEIFNIYYEGWRSPNKRGDSARDGSRIDGRGPRT